MVIREKPPSKRCCIRSRDIILSRQWTTKVLIRLCRCTGWSAPLLFAYGTNRFSHDVAHMFFMEKWRNSSFYYHPVFTTFVAVARSEACPLRMQAAPSSIPTSVTFFRGDLVMKTFLWPFSLFCWFKKSSCQLLAKECAVSIGKLPRRLAQELCG